MPTGAITEYIDVAQLVLYGFWIFFAGLVYYLRREDKREGYPLESSNSDRIKVQGFPSMPAPKVFRLRDGTEYSAPPGNPDRRDARITATSASAGAPLEPVGDPMLDAVGPAAYADRSERPDLTAEGDPKIVPLRTAPDYFLSHEDPDPRGMAVIGACGGLAGTVHEVWIDRAETIVRYLEVALPPAVGGRRVLLPMTFVRIDRRRGRVTVRSILAAQFANVPAIASDGVITLREEDRITAFFASGHLYATPRRGEPLL